jgi:glycosyltransferase involved in cell wall biosynthesis
MHILILTNRVPYPLKDGGSLAMHYFLEGYIKAGVKVSLLAMNTSKHFVSKDKLPAIYNELSHFETVHVNNEVNSLAAFINLFQINQSYNVKRFDNVEYHKKLKELLKKETFDFIQLEGLYLTPYVNTIRLHSKAKIILRSHNIEYKIWEKLYLQSNNILKKQYLKLLTQRLKKYEISHINDYDIILPISDVDKSFYLSKNVSVPLYTQTFGIEIKNNAQLERNFDKNNIKLYHIGAMDWLPNLESITWLIDEIMPEIYHSHPHVKLYLAGRKMPAALMERTYNNIDIIGEVEDAYEFEKDKDILLVPLLSGGGVRIKIFQGMAMGKAVVTTPIGVEGIDVSHKEHLLVADDKKEFVEYIRYLLDHPKEIVRLGKNAHEIITQQYDRKHQIAALLEFLNTHRN